VILQLSSDQVCQVAERLGCVEHLEQIQVSYPVRFQSVWLESLRFS
jgi:hypothetical protein